MISPFHLFTSTVPPAPHKLGLAALEPLVSLRWVDYLRLGQIRLAKAFEAFLCSQSLDGSYLPLNELLVETDSLIKAERLQWHFGDAA